MNEVRQAVPRDMLKALADDSRLAILRRLNNGELSVGDLAAQMTLGEPTVSHHLTRLREAGLVSLRMAGNQRFYSVNHGGLNQLKRWVQTIEQSPQETYTTPSDNAWIDALGWSESDAAILRDITRSGVLTHVPRARKKLLVILRWLATKFRADTLYSEKDVNAILKAAYPTDYVGLRRDLVDFGFLRREKSGSTYWLETKPEA